MEEVMVRDAAKADLPAIAALWFELARFHEARGRSFRLNRGAKAKYAAHQKESFGREGTRLAVAVCQRKVIGYCSMRVDVLPPIFDRSKVGQIIDMCVTARSRRRGIGHLLFQDAVRWFRSMDIDRIEVVFARANEISTKFWKGLGFKEFTEKRYLDI